MAVPLAVKDLRLALVAAEEIHVPMPAASLVHDHLVDRGWANLDWSALGLLAALIASPEARLAADGGAGLFTGGFQRSGIRGGWDNPGALCPMIARDVSVELKRLVRVHGAAL
jgi:hypothetical protein